jgi:hypothetical protein
MSITLEELFRTEVGQARASQLRSCAKWHERQAHRSPERAKHHHATSASLRAQANFVIRSTSNAINSKGF